MTKSIINSKQVKMAVRKAVDEALKECAFQQEAHGKTYDGVPQSNEAKEFSEAKPTQVKITIDFYFGEETHTNKHGKLVCVPIVNLTSIEQ